MTASPAPSIEHVDPDCRRLVRRGQVLALVLKLTNGKWCLADLRGLRLNKRSYANVYEAADAFKEFDA